MSKSKVVHTETYRNRKIVIVRMKIEGMDEWHNGYVSVVNRLQKEQPDYENYAEHYYGIDSLTFSGTLEQLEGLHPTWGSKWYFGFDSAHSWNDDIPTTKTKESVLKRARMLADKMVERGE